MPGWEKWEKFTNPKQPSEQQGTADKHPVSSEGEKKKKEQKSSSATTDKQQQQTFNSFDNLKKIRDSFPEDKDKDKDKDKENTNRERQSRPQNKHSQFERKNNRYKKKKNHNSGSSTMAEETFNISKYKDDKDFLASFVAENGNIDELAKTPEGQKRIKESWNKYQEKKNQSHSDDSKGKNDENKEDKGTLELSQGQTNDESHEEENSDWKAKKRESWKTWCENKDNHNGLAYTYDEDPEATGLKFDVFKDAEKTEKLATIEYTTPNSVSIDNDDGKVPNYEFFDHLVKDAKEFGHSAIGFNGEMTDEFKTKLALACIANDMPMKGFEERINIENLPDKGASLSDDIKKKIEYHNKYLMLQKAAENYKNNPENKDKPYQLKEGLSAEDAALTFAACTNAGVQVEGMDIINKDTHGMFIIPEKDKKLMPQAAQTAIKEFNDKTCKENITKIRQERVATMSDKEKKEYNSVQQARQNHHDDKLSSNGWEKRYLGKNRQNKREQRGLESLSPMSNEKYAAFNEAFKKRLQKTHN